MSVLSKLFGRHEEPPAADDVACPHTALIPRWESVDDMGKVDRATGFQCEACGSNFSPEEGRRLIH